MERLAAGLMSNQAKKVRQPWWWIAEGVEEGLVTGEGVVGEGEGEEGGGGEGG